MHAQGLFLCKLTILIHTLRYLNNNSARIVGCAANKKSEWRNQLFTSPPPSLPPFLYPFLLKVSGEHIRVLCDSGASTRASTRTSTLCDILVDLQQEKQAASTPICISTPIQPIHWCRLVFATRKHQQEHQQANCFFSYKLGRIMKDIGQNDQGDKVETSIGKLGSASLLKSHLEFSSAIVFLHW